jgi:hypothetical protein
LNEKPEIEMDFSISAVDKLSGMLGDFWRPIGVGMCVNLAIASD